MSHRLGGRQVRPDQTKEVKGQNGKTLVTTSTIKRPLPCPENGSKNRAFLWSRKKNRVKKKRREKKIRKKTEKKREKIKEE